MGNLVHPLSLRLNNNMYWNSQWVSYQNNKYSFLLSSDFLIYSYLNWFLKRRYFDRYKWSIFLSHFKIIRTNNKILIIFFMKDYKFYKFVKEYWMHLMKILKKRKYRKFFFYPSVIKLYLNKPKDKKLYFIYFLYLYFYFFTHYKQIKKFKDNNKKFVTDMSLNFFYLNKYVNNFLLYFILFLFYFNFIYQNFYSFQVDLRLLLVKYSSFFKFFILNIQNYILNIQNKKFKNIILNHIALINFNFVKKSKNKLIHINLKNEKKNNLIRLNIISQIYFKNQNMNLKVVNIYLKFFIKFLKYTKINKNFLKKKEKKDKLQKILKKKLNNKFNTLWQLKKNLIFINNIKMFFYYKNIKFFYFFIFKDFIKNKKIKKCYYFYNPYFQYTFIKPSSFNFDKIFKNKKINFKNKLKISKIKKINNKQNFKIINKKFVWYNLVLFQNLRVNYFNKIVKKQRLKKYHLKLESNINKIYRVRYDSTFIYFLYIISLNGIHKYSSKKDLIKQNLLNKRLKLKNFQKNNKNKNIFLFKNFFIFFKKFLNNIFLVIQSNNITNLILNLSTVLLSNLIIKKNLKFFFCSILYKIKFKLTMLSNFFYSKNKKIFYFIFRIVNNLQILLNKVKTKIIFKIDYNNFKKLLISWNYYNLIINSWYNELHFGRHLILKIFNIFNILKLIKTPSIISNICGLNTQDVWILNFIFFKQKDKSLFLNVLNQDLILKKKNHFKLNKYLNYLKCYKFNLLFSNFNNYLYFFKQNKLKKQIKKIIYIKIIKNLDIKIFNIIFYFVLKNLIFFKKLLLILKKNKIKNKKLFLFTFLKKIIYFKKFIKKIIKLKNNFYLNYFFNLLKKSNNNISYLYVCNLWKKIKLKKKNNNNLGKKIIINSKKFKISDLKINNIYDLKIIKFLKYQKKQILKIKTLIKEKQIINKILKKKQILKKNNKLNINKNIKFKNKNFIFEPIYFIHIVQRSRLKKLNFLKKINIENEYIYNPINKNFKFKIINCKLKKFKQEKKYKKIDCTFLINKKIISPKVVNKKVNEKANIKLNKKVSNNKIYKKKFFLKKIIKFVFKNKIINNNVNPFQLFFNNFYLKIIINQIMKKINRLKKKNTKILKIKNFNTLTNKKNDEYHNNFSNIKYNNFNNINNNKEYNRDIKYKFKYNNINNYKKKNNIINYNTSNQNTNNYNIKLNTNTNFDFTESIKQYNNKYNKNQFSNNKLNFYAEKKKKQILKNSYAAIANKFTINANRYNASFIKQIKYKLKLLSSITLNDLIKEFKINKNNKYYLIKKIKVKQIKILKLDKKLKIKERNKLEKKFNAILEKENNIELKKESNLNLKLQINHQIKKINKKIWKKKNKIIVNNNNLMYSSWILLNKKRRILKKTKFRLLLFKFFYLTKFKNIQVFYLYKIKMYLNFLMNNFNIFKNKILIKKKIKKYILVLFLNITINKINKVKKNIYKIFKKIKNKK